MPPRFSRMKIVWGNLGIESGGGMLVGLPDGGGVCCAEADMAKSLARQPWLVQLSAPKATRAPRRGTTPAV